jgi:hypothetical protein
MPPHFLLSKPYAYHLTILIPVSVKTRAGLTFPSFCPRRLGACEYGETDLPK